MNKTFVPQTRVPGATLVIDENYQPILDKKGRCQWDMTRAMRSGVAEHIIIEKKMVVEDGKAKVKMVKGPVQVPVYRGVPASFWRLIKSQAKRLNLIEAKEKEKEDGSTSERTEASEPAEAPDSAAPA